MAQGPQNLSKLSKDSLVAIGVQKINNPEFNPENFNRIEIWKEDKDLVIYFDHAIRFIPLNGKYYYSVRVSLVDGGPSMSVQGNGKLELDKIEFYQPAKFEKEIQFVINSINNSNGSVGKIPDGELPHGKMTIKDKKSYYDITVDSESTHSFYKIEKESGKIYDAGHKHYAHSNDGSGTRIY